MLLSFDTICQFFLELGRKKYFSVPTEARAAAAAAASHLSIHVQVVCQRGLLESGDLLGGRLLLPHHLLLPQRRLQLLDVAAHHLVTPPHLRRPRIEGDIRYAVLERFFSFFFPFSLQLATLYLQAANVVVFGEGVTARRRVLLAAAADAQAFLLLPEGPLLVAADPLQLLLHAHPGPAALGRAQLLLHRAARTLLLGRRGTNARWGSGGGGKERGGGAGGHTLELKEAFRVLQQDCVTRRLTRVSA